METRPGLIHSREKDFLSIVAKFLAAKYLDKFYVSGKLSKLNYAEMYPCKLKFLA